LHGNSVFFLLFPSIHDVLRAEKALKGHHLSFELVPVPRDLSSDCGMCVRLEAPVEEAISRLGDLHPEKCFSFDGTVYREWSGANAGG
jgi:hypothetical protein